MERKKFGGFERVTHTHEQGLSLFLEINYFFCVSHLVDQDESRQKSKDQIKQTTCVCVNTPFINLKTFLSSDDEDDLNFLSEQEDVFPRASSAVIIILPREESR